MVRVDMLYRTFNPYRILFLNILSRTLRMPSSIVSGRSGPVKSTLSRQLCCPCGVSIAAVGGDRTKRYFLTGGYFVPDVWQLHLARFRFGAVGSLAFLKLLRLHDRGRTPVLAWAICKVGLSKNSSSRLASVHSWTIKSIAVSSVNRMYMQS